MFSKKRHLTYVIFTIEEWCSIADNPVQRDTVRHANKAAHGHLAKPAETHQYVHYAITSEGKQYKLDGHTRAYLWAMGMLEYPSFLFGICHEVDSLEDVIRLYYQFDNRAASDDAQDLLSGVFNKVGLSTGALWREGRGSSALRILCGRADFASDREALVIEWKKEMEKLASEGFTHRQLSQPLIAAALALLRAYGSKSLEFWHLYVNDKGIKADGFVDGVFYLSAVLKNMKMAGRSSGEPAVHEKAGHAVRCFEAWKKNKLIKESRGLGHVKKRCCFGGDS